MPSPSVIPQRPVVDQALRRLRHPRLGLLARERLVLEAHRRFPTGRTNIGDRTPDLVSNPDGSLTITITHDEPDRPANWLPAPSGPFYLVFRCYGPRETIINGDWAPPQVRRA